LQKSRIEAEELSPLDWLGTYQGWISGTRRGVIPGLSRSLLRLAEFPYTWAVRIRNASFDRGTKPVHRVDVPVISVGNITTGGTGKTPMVAWLARWFRHQNVRVALISRGYGAADGGQNDEARELESLLPDVPHLQNPDRVAASQVAIEELATQLIILDDGFQHRRIHRDLEIVLVDALQPFGYGHVLPRGLLREPLSGLQRADVLVLSRADAVSEECRTELREQVRRWAPQATWCETAHQPTWLVDAGGEQHPVAELGGKRVAAFCGIGNPAAFRQALERLGCEVVAFRIFPDHHAYQREDLDQLNQWVSDASPDLVVCTRKDQVKLAVDCLNRVPLLALAVEIKMMDGLPQLEQHLRCLLSRLDRQDA
jgi:tetraacyldisaccharide 4'-kinase